MFHCLLNKFFELHFQCADIIFFAYFLLFLVLHQRPVWVSDVHTFGFFFLLNYHDTNSFKTHTCCVDAAPALVAITIYLVAGGDGWVGVPGRVDMRVSELGTLMMLGVREPPDVDNPLWDIDRVGRGCRVTEWAFRFDLNDFIKVFFLTKKKRTTGYDLDQLDKSFISDLLTCVIVSVVLFTVWAWKEACARALITCEQSMVPR